LTGAALHHEVLIGGFGGQGVVLAGHLLAAAALAENREVVWAPSYGPEMRGGPVHCTVIISSGRIGSPEVSSADSVLLMDRASDAPSDGNCEILGLPAGEVAEAIGDLRAANVVMLGAFLKRRPVVTKESLIAAMRSSAGKAFGHLLEINLRALERGEELAR
jgi:2-oxoglutarate ferredoxin oxidoreductase subunit gamma